MGFLKSVIDQLAKSGLIFRGDPPKVVDLTGREWGSEVGGFVLSVRQKAGGSGPQAVISVVLRNVGGEPRRLPVGEWLYFFDVRVTDEAGGEVPQTAFGRQSGKQGRQGANAGVVIEPEGPVEIEWPVGLFYEVRAGKRCRVRVSCSIPVGTGQETLFSNDCEVR